MRERFTYYLPPESGFPDFPVEVTFEWEYQPAEGDCPPSDSLEILHWSYSGGKNPLINEWILDHLDEIQETAWHSDPGEVIE